jgi:hypothetical protein
MSSGMTNCTQLLNVLSPYDCWSQLLRMTYLPLTSIYRYYKLYHAFSSFLLSTAVHYLMIPREEVELDDVTSYNIFDNKIYKISS